MTGYQYSMTGLRKLVKNWFFLILILVFSLVLLEPGMSHAAPAPPGSDIQSASLYEICTNTYDAGGMLIPNKPREGFTNKIVTCVEDVLIKTVDNTEFQNIRDQIKDAIGVILLLYIVLLGAEVALGKWKEPMAAIVGHIFKASLVCFFTLNVGLDVVYPMMTDALQAFTNMVTQNAISSSGGKCSSGPSGAYSVWQMADCVFASILAADLTSLSTSGNGDLAVEPFQSGAGKPYVLPAVAAGLIFAPVGVVVVALTALTIIITIIALASAVVYYLMCLVAVIVLTTVAPIFIPMIMFHSTKNMFDMWFQALISYIIQPAMLFGYLAFMTQAMTIVIYGTGSPDAKFGLHPFLVKAKGIMDDPTKNTSKFLIENDSELTHGGVVDPAVTATGKNLDASKSSIVGNTIELTDDEIAEFLVNLIVVAMITALLNSFMFNVMAFGGQLAGVPVNFNMGGFSRTFTSAMGTVKERFL